VLKIAGKTYKSIPALLFRSDQGRDILVEPIIRLFFHEIAQSVAAFTAVARSSKRAARRRLRAFRSSLPLRRVEQSKLKARTGKRGPLNSVFVIVTTSHYYFAAVI
jgi:hypothetical protein